MTVFFREKTVEGFSGDSRVNFHAEFQDLCDQLHRERSFRTLLQERLQNSPMIGAHFLSNWQEQRRMSCQIALLNKEGPELRDQIKKLSLKILKALVECPKERESKQKALETYKEEAAKLEESYRNLFSNVYKDGSLEARSSLDDEEKAKQKKELARVGFLRGSALRSIRLLEESLLKEEREEKWERDKAVFARAALFEKRNNCQLALDQASRYLKILQADPFYCPISALDHTINKEGRKMLEAYIGEKLTPEIRSKEQRVQELVEKSNGRIFMTTTELIDDATSRIFLKINGLFDYSFKNFSVEEQEKLTSFMKEWFQKTNRIALYRNN